MEEVCINEKPPVIAARRLEVRSWVNIGGSSVRRKVSFMLEVSLYVALVVTQKFYLMAETNLWWKRIKSK